MTCRLNQGPGDIIISCTVAIPNSSRNSRSATIWVLSVRQLRRQEKRALAVLADLIWTRYRLQSAEPANAPGSPALGDELAWSQAAFSRESVEVEALIRSALDTAEPMLQSSPVALAYELSEGMPRLALQLAPTKQALLNILTVALDWLAEGRLVLRAEHQPGDRDVSVSVTGYGALASTAAETGAERLSVGRELLSFSGGSLHHDAEPAGDQVCEIRLKLPTDSQISVLAIDDNPDTLQLLQRYTADTRYRLQCESDPAGSLALAEETMPDIILLDVLLQDIDGWELLGRFRAHPQTRRQACHRLHYLAAARSGPKPGRRRFLEQAPQPTESPRRPRRAS